jgi:hypothetical protein
MAAVSDAVAADHKANADEVRRHAKSIRRLAADLDLGTPRMRDDGTVVIHSTESGYRQANRLSAAASQIVGAYVHVITDDVPGAASVSDL